MKKAKILTVLGVLLAMGITACGSNTKKSESSQPQPSSSVEPAPSSSSQPAPSSSSQPAPSSSSSTPAHTHEMADEWKSDATNHWHECKANDGYVFDASKAAHTFVEDATKSVASTCTQAGKKVEVCSVCHYEKETPLPKTTHNYVEDKTQSVAATCSAPGKIVEICSICKDKRETPVEKLPHTFPNDGAWEIVKEASCVAGKKQRTCSVCGYVDEESIPPVEGAEHAWGPWEVVTPASCAKGREKRVCANCKIEDFRDIDPTGAHVWGEKVTIEDVTHIDDTDPDNPVTVLDKAGYDKYECTVCHGVRIEMDASKAKLDYHLDAQGNPTSTLSVFKTEEVTYKDENDQDVKMKVGVKLKNNDDSYSFKFDFDKAADVIVYQYGCMDGYSSNSNRTYYSGADDTNFTKANFDFAVNGKSIDLYGQRKVKISDVVQDRTDEKDPLYGKYSEFGEFLIGESELVKGENTFVYKRLASYNLIVSKIILEVTFPDHVHEAAADAEWVNTNEDFHWKNCSHGDGHKLEKGRHEFGEKWVETEPTCLAEGLAHQQCKVCGYVSNIAIDKLAHDYSVKLSDDAKTDDHAASEVLTCSENCGLKAIKWNAADYNLEKTTAASETDKLPKAGSKTGSIDFDDSSCQNDNKDETKKGTHIVYEINVPFAAENVGLSMLVTKRDTGDPMNKQNNDNRKGYYKDEAGEWQTPVSRYGLKVDGVEYLIDKYTGSEQTSSSTQKWFAFPVSFNLTAGVHEIELFKYFGYKADHYAFMLTGFPGEAHTLGDWVKTDADVHYKTCADVPEGKFMIRAHVWEDDPDNPDVARTCTVDGVDYSKCAICGAQKSEVSKAGHNVQVGAANTDGIKALSCSGCDDYCGFEFDGFADNGVGSNKACIDSSDKINKKVTMYWTLNMPKAGKVNVFINAKCSSGNENKAFADGWAIQGGASVNDLAAGVLTLDTSARVDTVLNASNYVFFEVGNVTVTEGTYVIAVTTYTSPQARLISDHAVRVIYE